MGYRFLDHTADVAVEIAAGSLPELFADAAAAFTDIVTDRRRVEERTARRFALAAAAPDLLLRDWLEELLYAFEVDGLLFRRAAVELADADGGLRLDAEAWGEPREEGRHPIKVLVKGVTYHGLEVVESAGRFTARVVFDI